MNISIFGGTDRGCVRERNEDAFFIDPKHQLACVCDGMGGHQGGAEASSMVVDVFKTYGILDATWRKEFDFYQNNVAMCQDENNLVNLAYIANEKVYSESLRDAKLSGMGSTLVALYVRRNKDVCVINVGDSRAYWIQGMNFRQLTVDHSLFEEKLQKGLIDENSDERQKIEHVITRAVGSDSHVEVDFFKEPIQEGYCLLCSDGLTSMLTDEEICICLKDASGDGEKAVNMLIEEAKGRGGTDNVTAVLFKVNK